MKRSSTRSLLAWIAFGAAACSSIELAGPNPSMSPAPAAPGLGAARIAQSGFGGDARFALCQPPACPRPSAKSLPAPASTPVAVEPSPSRATRAQDALTLAPTGSRRSPQSGPSEVIEGPSPLKAVVHFGFGRSDLDAAGRDALDLAATQPLPVRRVLIAGRTDSIGPAAANESLAQARAEAVQRYLTARHPRFLAGTEVRVQSQGTCCYAAANDSASGRAANRRVEVTFERDGGAL
ncbi:MAG: OmpA family protein [Piscinibacter sp.]|uniref:OmpA family protein n=1 Tax=Piscinibacter sp. TaxID=1903157 RepID=UPI002582E15A|nr:OmpA family protein [Piscinibacter sp.]MCW5663656.1 OmpA family protein [Piscinibacter sp.]